MFGVSSMLPARAREIWPALGRSPGPDFQELACYLGDEQSAVVMEAFWRDAKAGYEAARGALGTHLAVLPAPCQRGLPGG